MNLSFTGERYVPELRGQIYYEHFHRYAMVLELARGKDVLDIACGEGYGTAALSLVATSAVGVDNDGATIQHAAARYTAMNLDFRLGDCTQIPAGNAAFDLVVSFETIEHLVEQERMLKELTRVLRPDGLLVISSPNKLVYSDASAVQNPYHVRELYFHEFRDVLRSFFPTVKVFGQRIFAASAVHPLRGTVAETRWLGPSTTAEPAMGALPDPQYFIAICGLTESASVPDLSSVYLDPRDELLDDVRSGGLAAELNPPPESSNPTPALVAQLGEREREVAEYGDQARRLEEHAGGLEAMLEEGRHRSIELSSRIEELAASESRAQDELRAAAVERQRLERALAGLRLECDSMRDANAELQRQYDADLHAKESELLAERGRLDFEVMIARQEALRLQTQLQSTANALNARMAELQELHGRFDESENARRACEQLLAQLKLETYNWQDANERAAAAEAHLADIMRSRSWRLTMPARQFMTAMRARKPG